MLFGMLYFLFAVFQDFAPIHIIAHLVGLNFIFHLSHQSFVCATALYISMRESPRSARSSAYSIPLDCFECIFVPFHLVLLNTSLM